MTSMATTEGLGVLRPRISPGLPGCPDIVIEQAVRDAAIAFCEQTWCWRENLEPVFLMDSSSLSGSDFAESETEYDLDLSDNEQVIGVLSATIDNRDVAGNVRFDLPQARMFVPLSAGLDGVIEIEAAMAPSLDADAVPVFLRTRYGEAIASHVKYSLCALPDKPWTNYAQSQFHHTRYAQEVGRARVALHRNFTGHSLSVKPRKFA